MNELRCKRCRGTGREPGAGQCMAAMGPGGRCPEPAVGEMAVHYHGRSRPAWVKRCAKHLERAAKWRQRRLFQVAA